MWQDHFNWNGKTYYTGTVFIVREYKYQYGAYETEATFIAYNPEYDNVTFQVGSQMHGKKLDTVKRWIISVTDKKDDRVRCPVKKQMKDFDIDGLFIGWIWYIFLMLISSIFNDAVGMWIIISIAFFTWRSGKIKKEGTYIEW